MRRPHISRYALNVGIVVLLSACTPASCVKDKLGQLWDWIGGSRAPTSTITTSDKRQIDCTVILHYPEFVGVGPGGPYTEGEWVPATVDVTTWSTYCKDLPAIALTKINGSANSPGPYTPVALHPQRLDPANPFRFYGIYTISGGQYDIPIWSLTHFVGYYAS